MRHLEILGSGSVPYFPEIETIAKHSVGYLPKELLKKVLSLSGVDHIGPVPERSVLNQKTHQFYDPIHSHHIHFKKRGTINAAKFNVAEYYLIADALLDYTKKYLTCGSMVASILQRLGPHAENAKNILVVSRFSYDYLHQMIHVGLTELGIAFTVVGEDSKIWSHRLNSCSPLQNMTEVKRGEEIQRLPYLYGNGLGVPVRAFNGDHNIKYVTDRANDNELKKSIKKREFGVVLYSYIYAGMSRNAPYLNLVKQLYSKREIAFFDHEDAHFGGAYEYVHLNKIGTVFARELDEHRSCR